MTHTRAYRVKKLCRKQCFCTHKALQAMSLSIQSGLVGQHPKPFDCAAPAGRSTSAGYHLGDVTEMFFTGGHFLTL